MLNINKTIDKIRQSDSVALNDKIQSLKNNGADVIPLNAGDPNFDTPQPIIEASLGALKKGCTHYSDSRGMFQLRNAISNKLINYNKVEYSPDSEILITSGAVHAYYTGLQALLNKGDEVLVPDPAWMTHTNLVELLGGRVIRVPGYKENNFFPSISALQENLSSKTIAVVINSPNNPTGCVADKNYLEQIAEFVLENDLFSISDEVYERIIFDGKTNISMAEFSKVKDRTLLLHSFSKTYAMTGWRIGYLAAPEFVIDQAIKASQYSITNVPLFIQYGALAALKDESVEVIVEGMRNEYELRRNAVIDIFAERGDNIITFDPPGGAFYIFLDVRKLNNPSVKIAKHLLDETGVAVVSGSVYGNNGEGFLRLSLAADLNEIKTGVNKLLDWVNEKF